MELLKIKSTHQESQGAFVLIEKKDFNEKIHVLFVENEVIQPKKGSK